MPSGAQMTWQFEIVAHLEITGAVDSPTRSEADTQGMSAIRTLIEGGLDGDPGTTLYQEAVRMVERMGPESVSGFVTTAAKAGLNLYMGSM